MPQKQLVIAALAADAILREAVAPARAVDVHVDPGPPSADLAPARALIKAKDFSKAVEALFILERTNRTADLYNLLGFSLRNLGDYERSAENYRMALALDPDHKSALEYQGELFIRLGQTELALQNLRRLETLCPQGCEEREDLEEALAAASRAKP